MKSFTDYLNDTGEVGFVEQLTRSVAYVRGLPSLRPGEVVMIESGGFAEVVALSEEHAEILLVYGGDIRVGTRVAKTGNQLAVQVGDGMLGHSLTGIGLPLDDDRPIEGHCESRLIESPPPPIFTRKNIDEPFETGVCLVDISVPMGKGQRELVIGDIKIGKTDFLLQAARNHVLNGGICVYAGIAKRIGDRAIVQSFFDDNKIMKNSVLVFSHAIDELGMIYKTPYTAMTIAEYFRDQDKHVLLILDDLSVHAKYYREISLLAQRFPGRDAYPGDIFFLHSRLLERAGNFATGAITCLPVVHTAMGDISGYIQTNLMSMTDGHIFFDYERYNKGQRPAVNTFLSVTRVGHQAQTPMMKSASSYMLKFFVDYQKLVELNKFGSDLGEEAKQRLAIGGQVQEFFNQGSNEIVSHSVAALFLSCVLSASWLDVKMAHIHQRMYQVSHFYRSDKRWIEYIEKLLTSKDSFTKLIASSTEFCSQLLGEIDQADVGLNEPSDQQAKA